MSSLCARPISARSAAARNPARVFLRRTSTHNLPSSSISRCPAAGQRQLIVVVADEQQRRVDPRLFVVGREGQALVAKTKQGAHRGDRHRQPLAAAEAFALQVAVDDHQRIEADGAVVDERAAVHLGDVDPPLGAGGDQRRRFVEVGRNAEIAGEMVERAERQDAEPGRAVRDRAGGGADGPVAAADDQQRIAALDDRPAAHLGLAAVDHLDFGLDAGPAERRLDLGRDLVVGGRRTATAIDQDGGARLCQPALCQVAGPIRNAASLLPSRSRK